MDITDFIPACTHFRGDPRPTFDLWPYDAHPSIIDNVDDRDLRVVVAAEQLRTYLQPETVDFCRALLRHFLRRTISSGPTVGIKLALEAVSPRQRRDTSPAAYAPPGGRYAINTVAEQRAHAHKIEVPNIKRCPRNRASETEAQQRNRMAAYAKRARSEHPFVTPDDYFVAHVATMINQTITRDGAYADAQRYTSSTGLSEYINTPSLTSAAVHMRIHGRSGAVYPLELGELNRFLSRVGVASSYPCPRVTHDHIRHAIYYFAFNIINNSSTDNHPARLSQFSKLLLAYFLKGSEAWKHFRSINYDHKLSLDHAMHGVESGDVEAVSTTCCDYLNALSPVPGENAETTAPLFGPFGYEPRFALAAVAYNRQLTEEGRLIAATQPAWAAHNAKIAAR